MTCFYSALIIINDLEICLHFKFLQCLYLIVFSFKCSVYSADKSIYFQYVPINIRGKLSIFLIAIEFYLNFMIFTLCFFVLFIMSDNLSCMLLFYIFL